MKVFLNIFKFQMKILALSTIKIIISVFTALLIPLLFGEQNPVFAAYKLDLYIILPVVILFAELYNIEYTSGTEEILYCTKRRKTMLMAQRICAMLVLFLVLSALAYMIYIIKYPYMLMDEKFSALLILKMLYALFCSFVFFGALSTTATNMFGTYFAGVGLSMLIYVIFYRVDFFNSDNIFSFFIFEKYDIWPYSKLFYLCIGTLLLIINDYLVNSSPRNLMYECLKYKLNKVKTFRIMKD